MESTKKILLRRAKLNRKTGQRNKMKHFLKQLKEETRFASSNEMGDSLCSEVFSHSALSSTLAGFFGVKKERSKKHVFKNALFTKN